MRIIFKKQLSFLIAVVLVISLFMAVPLTVNADTFDPNLLITKISEHPTSQSVPAGGNVSFSVTANNVTSYQWQQKMKAPDGLFILYIWADISDNEIFSGTATKTLNLANVPANYNGYQYRCIVTSYIGNKKIESEAAVLTVTAANTPPSITGEANLSMIAGYSATSSAAYTITGAPAPTVTLSSPDPKITWNNSTKKIDIAAGLTPGVYYVILQAENIVDNKLFFVTITVSDTNTAPNITGEAAISLTAGYTATSSAVYTITGLPAPTVTMTSSDPKITWNNSTKKLDIAAGLTPGVYQVILQAQNSVDNTLFIVAITVSDTNSAPVIKGESTISLTAGYTAKSTEAYTITGFPVPNVKKASGDSKITWNNSTKKLDIAAGLTPGVYQVILQAENSVDDTLFIVTITVVSDTNSAPVIKGESTISLTAGYTAKSTEAYTITGFPVPTVTKASGDSKITWNNSTKKLDISAGLTNGVYKVILQAENSVDKTLFIVTITVGDQHPDYMLNFVKTKSYRRGQFDDVNETIWYGFDQLKVIANAYEYDLMKGKSDSIFDPDGNITVAEAITMAVRVHSIYTTGKATAPVTDPWYKGFVDYAVKNDIIPANAFDDYDRPATRAEMVFIFSRSLPETEFVEQNTVNSLPDVNKNTPYSESIFNMYKAGVLLGNDAKGTFAPNNNITRAEAAAIITRVILPSTRGSDKTF
jgi:S-layer homology domain.